eukprot:8100558-Pyramimonas_sp.AAC.1
MRRSSSALTAAGLPSRANLAPTTPASHLAAAPAARAARAAASGAGRPPSAPAPRQQRRHYALAQSKTLRVFE